MQPFGPDDTPTFTLPGSHYRGFAALACCDACKARVQAGEQVAFAYRQQPYIISSQRVYASPF
jgi:hypothetical protein